MNLVDYMATKQIVHVASDVESKRCPKCNSTEILTINGVFVKWLTCQKCKYKKLIENKEKPKVKVESLMEQDKMLQS